jgi:WD40 repeat protein
VFTPNAKQEADAVLIRRREAATGKELPPLARPSGKIPRMFGALALSPDGRTVAAADNEGVLLWDAATAKVQATLRQEGQRFIRALAFSPDGRLLATAVGDPPGRTHEPGVIVLWDPSTGRQLATLTGHTNAVNALAFCPDGRTLASGGQDRTVRLWDMTKVPAGPARPGQR